MLVKCFEGKHTNRQTRPITAVGWFSAWFLCLCFIHPNIYRGCEHDLVFGQGMGGERYCAKSVIYSNGTISVVHILEKAKHEDQSGSFSNHLEIRGHLFV